MARFNVIINRTRTIEYSFEVEVSAKDEESAQEKAEAKVQKALDNAALDTAFDWETASDDDSFEYEINEA